VTGAPPIVWVVAGLKTAERWVVRLREAGFAAGALAWAEGKALDFDEGLLGPHDLVLLTSVRAAGSLPRAWCAGRPAACVGAKTAEAARGHGYDVVLVGEAGGEALARQILKRKPRPKRVLYPCGQEARPEAPGVLAHGGLDVDELPVYAMEPLADFPERVARAPEPAAIVLGSPKAAEALHAAGRALPDKVALLALGSITAERAQALFARSVTQTPSADATGVVAAIRAAFREPGTP